MLFLIVFSLVNRSFANSILPLPAIPAKGNSTGNRNFMVVKITYNNDFPYNKNYENRNIEGCYKFHLTENNDVLRCREYISIIRSWVVLKKWLELQQKKKYFIFSLNEFGILNAKAKIVSVQPANWSVKEPMRVKKGNSIVSGVFIRHTTDVRKYGFMRKGNNAIAYINATKNHLFYVRNRDKFIPVNRISATDLLINDDGKDFLLHSCSDLKEDRKLNTHIPRTVYNIELHSNHTYFVGKQKIFVHNTCNFELYLRWLHEQNLVYNQDGKGLRINVKKDQLHLLAYTDAEKAALRQKPGAIPSRISQRLRFMGWQQISTYTVNEKNLYEYKVWKLAIDLSCEDYLELIPFLGCKKLEGPTTALTYLLKAQEELDYCRLSQEVSASLSADVGAKSSLSPAIDTPSSAGLSRDKYNIPSIESYNLPPGENLPFLDVFVLDYNELQAGGNTLYFTGKNFFLQINSRR